jgi:hypothetical protein
MSRLGFQPKSTTGGTAVVDYEGVNDALDFEITRDLETTVSFDYEKNIYNLHTVTEDLTLGIDLTGARDVSTAILAIQADGVHTVDFPEEWISIGAPFDNTEYMVNYIMALKFFDHYTYNIYDTLNLTPAPPEQQSFTILATSGISKNENTYTSTTGSSFAPVAVFNEYLADGVEASVVFEMTEAALSTGIMVGLSSSQTNHKYSESPNYYGMYIQGGAPTMFSITPPTPTLTQLNPSFANGSKIRISRSAANNLLLEYANDGTTYVTKKDYGTVTGTLYVHINIQASGESITNLVGYGLTSPESIYYSLMPEIHLEPGTAGTDSPII